MSPDTHSALAGTPIGGSLGALAGFKMAAPLSVAAAHGTSLGLGAGAVIGSAGAWYAGVVLVDRIIERDTAPDHF